MLDKLAVELNETLDTSVAGAFLSGFGRRIFFPKGIVAQSAEAGAKAKKYNATVGLARSKGQPMYLSDIYSAFCDDGLKPNDIFSYAPGGGDRTLRALWKEEMVRKNPSLKGQTFSLPMVTGGLTHTISLVANIFFDEGDEIVCPDLFWDNYELIFVHTRNGRMIPFSFFTEQGQVRGNVDGALGIFAGSAKSEITFWPDTLPVVTDPSGPTLLPPPAVQRLLAPQQPSKYEK